MSTVTIIGPLRYCKCGHGEAEHDQWLFACETKSCACSTYRRDRSRWRENLAGPTGGEPR